MDKIDTSNIGDSQLLAVANAVNALIDHVSAKPAETPATPPVEPTAPAADAETASVAG